MCLLQIIMKVILYLNNIVCILHLKKKKSIYVLPIDNGVIIIINNNNGIIIVFCIGSLKILKKKKTFNSISENRLIGLASVRKGNERKSLETLYDYFLYN